MATWWYVILLLLVGTIKWKSELHSKLKLPNNRRFVLQVLLFPTNIKIEFRVVSKQLRMVGNVCYAIG